jgi:hypothetical protein
VKERVIEGRVIEERSLLGGVIRVRIFRRFDPFIIRIHPMR